MRQYWRGFEALEAWTRSEPHRLWWQRFLRDSGGVNRYRLRRLAQLLRYACDRIAEMRIVDGMGVFQCPSDFDRRIRDALDSAQRKGFTNRDPKPANLAKKLVAIGASMYTNQGWEARMDIPADTLELRVPSFRVTVFRYSSFQGAILKNKASVLITLSAAIMLSQTALADVGFSFAGPGGISGSGVFTVTPTANPTIDDITGIIGTFVDVGDGVSGPISGLVPSLYSNVCPGAANFSQAGYSYDNLYYPQGSPAICAFDYPFSGGVLDIFGVLFNVNDAGTTYTVNLWSNGVLPGIGLSYGLSLAQGANTINDGVGGNGVNLSSFTSTPEPRYLFVVNIALVVLIVLRMRKTKSSPNA